MDQNSARVLRALLCMRTVFTINLSRDLLLSRTIVSLTIVLNRQNRVQFRKEEVYTLVGIEEYLAVHELLNNASQDCDK